MSKPNGGDRQRQYMESNRRSWNERTPVHARSDFYGIERFKAGATSLLSVELEEMGDVQGKSLLHLQCHFGMDTLSWARLGANVTGADFSDEAIDLARSLSGELGIEAEFVLSNVYSLPDVLEAQYDIVFTSYGVLVWLPDLKPWAEVVAHFLRPGGFFYIVDGTLLVTSCTTKTTPRTCDLTTSTPSRPRARWSSRLGRPTPTARPYCPPQRTSGIIAWAT